MRRLLIVALLASCERLESPPPPAPPRDGADVPVDATPACKRQPDPARLKALDAFRDYATTVKRERDEVEAPTELTDAYIALELSYAYARLGADTRALVLKTKAHRSLDEHARTDHVHHTLLAIYDARIEQAQRCQAADTALPLAVETELSNLTRIERYKVDRLREASATLTREYVVDAMGEFSARPSPDDAFNVVRRAGDPAERARLLDKALDALPSDPHRREQQLVMALDAISTLPPTLAKPLLVRIAGMVQPSGSLAKADNQQYERALSWVVFGNLIAVAVRGDPALARASVELAAKQIDGDPATLDTVLQPSVLALRGEPALLRTLLASATPAPGTRTDREPHSFAIAKALVITGDTANAKVVIDDLRSYVSGLETSRSQEIRELAGIYALAPIGSALPDLEKLEPELAKATDSFSTNTHFCRSPITVVAAISHGIIGE